MRRLFVIVIYDTGRQIYCNQLCQKENENLTYSTAFWEICFDRSYNVQIDIHTDFTLLFHMLSSTICKHVFTIYSILLKKYKPFQATVLFSNQNL